MEALDKVTAFKNQGLQDADIVKRLEDEGISPREISDAMSQSKIKQAVSPEQPTQDMSSMQGMEQSIMPGQALQEQEQEQQTQMQQMQSPQEQAYPQQGNEQAYYQTPQAYPQQAYYPQQPQIDTETIAEIAEQVILEKFREFSEKTGDISSFKTHTLEELKDLDERLKRIEQSIEQLQQEVIKKISEFGETGEYIKKDLNSLHNTVSKLMNPLIDNFRELKKISGGK